MLLVCLTDVSELNCVENIKIAKALDINYACPPPPSQKWSPLRYTKS